VREPGKPRFGLKALCAILALLPPARMAWIVFTTGENNLSNDYIGRVPLVLSILDGSCTLTKFVRGAWVAGGHSMIALIPIYCLNARFFEWSVWVDLGLGLALAGAALALLAASIPVRARWPLVPLLSLLLFSTSRVTVFTFGEPALQYGVSQLGVAFGAFALARWSRRPVLLATALALGGVLASWCWAGGLMAWPVFAVALLLLRVRSAAAWAVLIFGGILGVAQYVWLLLLGVPDPAAVRLTPRPRFWSIFDLLGRPFVNEVGRNFAFSGASQLVGLAGLALLIYVLVRGRGSPRAASALVLVAWTLLVAVQIAAFRSEVAPWYVSPMAFFWCGLAIFLSLSTAPFPVRAAGLAVIALLTLRVQATWEDKSFYLPSRSPGSAACLREWRTAPPECHHLIFQWGDVGRLGEVGLLAEPLEQHGLSVFGSRRTYLLQGDVAVGRVVVETPNRQAFLSRDGVVAADPTDFHRLDLVLSPEAAVSWRVDVPARLRAVRFVSALRTRASDPKDGRSARFTVVSKDVQLEDRVFLPHGKARPVSIDLARFAGQTIRIEIRSEEARETTAPIRFEVPRIEMELLPAPRKSP
jgi:hypothetical protein